MDNRTVVCSRQRYYQTKRCLMKFSAISFFVEQSLREEHGHRHISYPSKNLIDKRSENEKIRLVIKLI